MATSMTATAVPMGYDSRTRFHVNAFIDVNVLSAKALLVQKVTYTNFIS